MKLSGSHNRIKFSWDARGNWSIERRSSTRSQQVLSPPEYNDFLLTHSIHSGLHDRLEVVLVSPRNPLNIGAAARAMANFGFSQLSVVSPYDVAFREARSAVGAAPLLASAEEFA